MKLFIYIIKLIKYFILIILMCININSMYTSFLNIIINVNILNFLN